jgi:hypothetical protein
MNRTKAKSSAEWIIKVSSFIIAAASFFKMFGAKALTTVIGVGIAADGVFA